MQFLIRYLLKFLRLSKRLVKNHVNLSVLISILKILCIMREARWIIHISSVPQDSAVKESKEHVMTHTRMQMHIEVSFDPATLRQQSRWIPTAFAKMRPQILSFFSLRISILLRGKFDYKACRPCRLPNRCPVTRLSSVILIRKVAWVNDSMRLARVFLAGREISFFSFWGNVGNAIRCNESCEKWPGVKLRNVLVPPPRRSFFDMAASIFFELSPRSKLSAWQQFNRNVLLRGCAWPGTRSAASKKKSPSMLPALEYPSRTSLDFNRFASECIGNRESNLNKSHVSD